MFITSDIPRSDGVNPACIFQCVLYSSWLFMAYETFVAEEMKFIYSWYH
jgi:hypothetical protein